VALRRAHRAGHHGQDASAGAAVHRWSQFEWRRLVANGRQCTRGDLGHQGGLGPRRLLRDSCAGAIQGIADAFGCGEGELFQGGDGDRLAVCWIATLTFGPVGDLEAAEPGERHLFAGADRGGDSGEALSTIFLACPLAMSCSSATRSIKSAVFILFYSLLSNGWF
jgi:hypothetical protein